MELEMTHNHIPGTNQIGNGDIRGDTVQSSTANPNNTANTSSSANPSSNANPNNNSHFENRGPQVDNRFIVGDSDKDHKQPWVFMVFVGASLTVVGVVAITLPLTLMHKSTGASTNGESDNPKPPTSFPLSPSTLDAPPEKPTTPASSYPLTSAIATALSSIGSVTSQTPIPSPSPTPQPLAPTIQSPAPAIPSPSPTRKEAITSYAAFLTPGALCTADSQCSPNICYTEPNTVTYCCGPTITGCPGSLHGDPGHRDCKDPFKCDFQAFTCSLG